MPIDAIENKGLDKQPVNLSLSREGRINLAGLSELLGTSKSNTIERLIKWALEPWIEYHQDPQILKEWMEQEKMKPKEAWRIKDRATSLTVKFPLIEASKDIEKHLHQRFADLHWIIEVNEMQDPDDRGIGQTYGRRGQ